MSIPKTDEPVEKICPWLWTKDIDPQEITVANMLETYNLNTERFPREIAAGPRISIVRNPFWIKRVGLQKCHNMCKEGNITLWY